MLYYGGVSYHTSYTVISDILTSPFTNRSFSCSVHGCLVVGFFVGCVHDEPEVVIIDEVLPFT